MAKLYSFPPLHSSIDRLLTAAHAECFRRFRHQEKCNSEHVTLHSATAIYTPGPAPSSSMVQHSHLNSKPVTSMGDRRYGYSYPPPQGYYNGPPVMAPPQYAPPPRREPSFLEGCLAALCCCCLIDECCCDPSVICVT